MKLYKSFLNFIKNKKNILIIGGILVLVGVFFLNKNSSKNEGFIVKRGDLIKSVVISGKTVALQDVNLSFDTGGTVFTVYKKVGDSVNAGEIIAALDSRELKASREKAVANLLAAEAELAKLKSGASSDTEVYSDTRDIVNAIFEAYTVSDDAVHSKVDQYFDNPGESAPKIKYSFYNYFNTRDEINEKRMSTEESLRAWKSILVELNASNYSPEILSKSIKYLSIIKSFLDTVAKAVNTFEVSDELTQTSIDKYRTDLATARTNINSSISDLSSTQNELRGSISDIPVQEAKVRAAQADVASLDAQIAETIIFAPFSGVVSLQDAKTGQSIGAHEKVASLISSGLQIEAFIPEISIPGVALGNKANVSLDAYPGISFEAVISHIDPAETVRDGVSNYKINLSFASDDIRIRPGMTGNVSIETEKKSGVLAVPERSIENDGGINYVYKKTGKENIKKEIMLGVKDGKGNVEVVSGLEEGEEILLNFPEK